jgi:O-antigen/teichoic acid export membrane protein
LNTAWNIAGNGIPLVAGAVAIPILLRHLGNEQFGILTLLWALVGYLSLFDLGLGRAVTQQVSVNIANGTPNENSTLIDTAVRLTATAGVVGGVGLFVLARALAYRWLGVTVEHQADVFHALQVTAAAVPLTTVSAAYRGALEGYEAFREVNVVRLALGAGSFLLPLAMAFVWPGSLVAISFSLVATRAVGALAFFVAVRRFHRGHRIIGWYSSVHAVQLFRFGSWMTLSNIISPVLVYADRFMLSHVSSAPAIVQYTIPFEVIIRLHVIPLALSQTLFPGFAKAEGGASVRAVVRRSALGIGAVLAVCYGALIVGYVPVIGRWIGVTMAHNTVHIAAILAIGACVNGAAFVVYAAVQACAGSRATGILHCVELLMYAPVLLACVRLWGPTGAALAWTSRVAIDCAVLCILFEVLTRHTGPARQVTPRRQGALAGGE